MGVEGSYVIPVNSNVTTWQRDLERLLSVLRSRDVLKLILMLGLDVLVAESVSTWMVE